MKITDEIDKVIDRIDKQMFSLKVNPYARDMAKEDLRKIKQSLSEDAEDAKVLWTECVFEGLPPEPYTDWYDFCSSSVKKNVIIKAKESDRDD